MINEHTIFGENGSFCHWLIGMERAASEIYVKLSIEMVWEMSMFFGN